MRFISFFLFSADKRGRCGTLFLIFFFLILLVLQSQIKQSSCFKSEGPFFALHKKTNEGGDTDDISLYIEVGCTWQFYRHVGQSWAHRVFSKGWWPMTRKKSKNWKLDKNSPATSRFLVFGWNWPKEPDKKWSKHGIDKEPDKKWSKHGIHLHLFVLN